LSGGKLGVPSIGRALYGRSLSIYNGKRLRPLLPILVEAMERHGHLDLAPEVRARLLAISAATIDRALVDIR
jgi:hypothetical protein